MKPFYFDYVEIFYECNPKNLVIFITLFVIQIIFTENKENSMISFNRFSYQETKVHFSSYVSIQTFERTALNP